jgi:hypothetical protein
VQIAGASEVAPAQTQVQQDASATVDWSHGVASWQQATEAQGNTSLWTEPNFCDARVLHGSAPLSVLFGISKIWDEIKHRRVSLAQSGEAPQADGKPLEVHILGSAYPFEGRSDWSLLASRRPPDVPKVRVVLVLGTPWHQDNVPVMKADEFDEERSLLQVSEQLGAKVPKPETGKIKDGAIQCANKGAISTEDSNFKKADLCRDHGNGLEVVCIEKYYQEASADLPKPDVVAMFSPGFPQIARRSWDQVLTSLLTTEVPIMVCDLLYATSVDRVFTSGKSKQVAQPGSSWAVKRTRFEDGMTLRAMRAYGARRLGAYRNPFPILITRGQNDVTAKNAVLQMFRGRLASAKPLKLPSAAWIEKRKKMVKAMILGHLDDDSNAEEIKTSMLLPTTAAYDRAMYQIYRAQVRRYVKDELRALRKKNKPIDEEWMSMVVKLGLTGEPRKKPLNLKEWAFILQKLKVADEFML